MMESLSDWMTAHPMWQPVLWVVLSVPVTWHMHVEMRNYRIATGAFSRQSLNRPYLMAMLAWMFPWLMGFFLSLGSDLPQWPMWLAYLSGIVYAVGHGELYDRARECERELEHSKHYDHVPSCIECSRDKRHAVNWMAKHQLLEQAKGETRQ